LRRRIGNDPWAKTLGIEFLNLRRGLCRLRMQLRSHMVDFQGYPHGGVVGEAREVRQGRQAGFYQLSVATQDGQAAAVAPAIAHRVTTQGKMRRTHACVE
jgi:acyl-coenzyme A thioesterase PaaI-like protein